MKMKRGIAFLVICVSILVGLLAVLPANAAERIISIYDWEVAFAKREGTYNADNTDILCDEPGLATMGPVDEADFYLATLDETGADPATGKKIKITKITVTEPDHPDENFQKHFTCQITREGASAKIHVDRKVGVEEIRFSVSYQEIISGESPADGDLSFCIIIEKDTRKPVDLSGVKWDYTEAFAYDKSEKSVHLTGVPDEVQVTYTDNTATAVGQYTAKAELSIKESKKTEYRIDGPVPDAITSLEWEIVFPENVAAVINLINQLPEKQNVTLADQDAINAARAAYNALTDSEKTLIDADVLKKLTDAESALASLATPEKKPTKIQGNSLSATYKSDKKLVVTLTDSNGKPISGRTLIVKVGTISKNMKTDAKGKISVPVTSLVPKSYTAQIQFPGDNDYKASSASIKVTINKGKATIKAASKTFRKKDKSKIYTVTLLDSGKKPVKNVKITIKVNGKTYSAKTNAKGVAKFKITNLKKAGTYKATVKYAGNKYYRQSSKTVKIKVKK